MDIKIDGQITSKIIKEPSFVNSRGILFENDCLAVMSEIKSNSVDCIFADPPFNINKSYHDTAYKDNLEAHKYEIWIEEWLLECVRILRPGGSLFIYHMPYDLIKIANHLNSYSSMIFKNWIALNMKNGFPIKRRMQPNHYGLLYYVKNGANYTFNVVRTRTPTCRKCGALQKDYGGYRHKFKKWEDEAGVPWIQISDLWEDTRPVRHHKARQKQVNELPYEIAERAILMSTNEGDIIFDPFGGSGSTYYAACINNRYWIGSEIGNTNFLIRRLFDYEKKILINPPTTVLNKFKDKRDKAKFKISPERKACLKELRTDYEKGLLQSKAPQNKGRYSHRMTNKIFDL